MYNSAYMPFHYLAPYCIQFLAAVPLRLLFRFFIHTEIIGLEHIRPLRTPFILASNHSHELDPLLLVASLPLPARQLPLIFVSRTKQFYQPLGWRSVFYGGTLFQLLGALPAYPGLDNYDLALTSHLHALSTGQSVCIFPLGKRHTDSDTGAARGGVAYLTYKTNAPIIPVRITGVTDLTVRHFFRRTRTVRITFGKPLIFADISKNELTTPPNAERNRFEQAASVVMEKIIALDTLG